MHVHQYPASGIITGLEQAVGSTRPANHHHHEHHEHHEPHASSVGTLHNVLTLESLATDGPMRYGNGSLTATPKAAGAKGSGRTFNPYPVMGGTNAVAWPRGFPYFDVRDLRSTPPLLGWSVCTNASRDVPFATLGVVQSLADHDPDVDGVYRLTQPTHFNFPLDGPSVVLPPGKLAPYNAQASLHTHAALWSLLLPASVHGRVSDIWRGYLAQRLFWDLGLRLAFAPPSVWQERNPHNWLADLNAEEQLYERSGKLVDFLVEWECDADGATALHTCIEALWTAAYERGYIEKSDVTLMQAWLQALSDAQYPFPRRLPLAAREKLERDERAEWVTILSNATAARQAARRPLSASAFFTAAAKPGTLPIDTPCAPAADGAVPYATADDGTLELKHPPPLGPKRVADSEKERFGRTAICMSGFARSLFATFPKGINVDRWTANWTHRWAWAGSRTTDGPHGSVDWITAHSIRNNVLHVLAANGGYDLFVVEPGTGPHESRYEVLADNTVNAKGERNNVVYLQGGPEPDPAQLPEYRAVKDNRWTANFESLSHIKSLIYQLKHMRMCNEAVNAHADKSGVEYMYKMRLRPDMGWIWPMPPPHELNLDAHTIRITSKKWYPGGNEDTFAIGLAQPMDVYLDRERVVHPFPPLGVRGHHFNAEKIAVEILHASGISLAQHESLRGIIIRPAVFVRGAELAALNHTRRARRARRARR